jgi:hypothetical protein
MRNLIICIGAIVALVGCALLNPDPQRGGPCGNGDQLCAPCKDGSACPYGYQCASDGRGCEIDPGEWGPGDVSNNMGAHRDAG